MRTTEATAAAQDWPPPFACGLYWTDMTVGSAYSTAARTVTETDLMRFVALGFTEPLFINQAGAQAAGYRGRLVPGALTFSLAEGLLMQTNVIHGTGLPVAWAAPEDGSARLTTVASGIGPLMTGLPLLRPASRWPPPGRPEAP